MNEVRRLKRGMTVSDIGNRPVGQVEAIRGMAFAVDVGGGERVWLREDVLFSVDDSSATLICPANGIRRYALPEERSVQPSQSLARDASG